ncbi:MAG: hypothetical protein OXH00_26115 [Candidatus Poribacteria bacterium]|nr:hypothetical protein [Candidatus Poribacteria bacterium]
MNEVTTFSDFTKEEELFADVIIEIVVRTHEHNKRNYEKIGEDILLENIPFGIKRVEDRDLFENHIGIGNLQEIAKIQGRDEKWNVTAQRMLDKFCNIGQIVVYSEDYGIYRLNKNGFLYKYLAETLGQTP